MQSKSQIENGLLKCVHDIQNILKDLRETEESRLYLHLYRRRQLGQILTRSEQEILSADSHSAVLERTKTKTEIAARVRPGLIQQVWALIPFIEIDFPKTIRFKREFEGLLEAVPEDVHDLEWLVDFCLGLNELLERALVAVRPYAEAAPITEQGIAAEPSISTPKASKSESRLQFQGKLASELTAIHQIRHKYRTPEDLIRATEKFQVWELMTQEETKNILELEFTPKSFADDLTLRRYAITSKETLRKDRAKTRKAQRKPLN